MKEVDRSQNYARTQKNIITPPPEPSYHSKGKTVHIIPDLLLSKSRAIVTQPKNEAWNDASEHTPVVY